MGKQLFIEANAKINLGLDVLRRREDGYHEVKMVMQSLALADDVLLETLDEDIIRLSTSSKELPDDSRNLAYKAAAALKSRYGIRQGIGITIEKRIPIAAGMAGGSADAAAVLKGIDALFDLGLGQDNLQEIALTLGADVPYCVMGGLALAEGIGEKLSRIDGVYGYPVLIAKPDLAISTKYVYEHLKLDSDAPHPDIDQIISDLQSGDVTAMASHLGNLLETVTIAEYPVIRTLKEQMVSFGALNALMSGSGPTVFGIFENEAALYYAYDEMKKLGTAKEIIITAAV